MDYYEYQPVYHEDYPDYVPDTVCPPQLAHPHPKGFPDDGQLYCNSTFDTVSCWPTTLAGEAAILPCPSHFNHIMFDTSINASKICFPNGTWEEIANYSSCRTMTKTEIHNYITRVIYHVGYITSLIALLVALCIFLGFRSLRCLRNTIHCHLIVTFIIRIVIWITMNQVLPLATAQEYPHTLYYVCRAIVLIYNYIQVSNFFWMLVEGLYLHTIIVWAFAVERVRFWKYALLGWGAPAVVAVAWCIVRGLNDKDDSCWLPTEEAHWDYIYMAPILLVLLINIIFLASIMWVLITKLRATNTLESRQYRKAVRATAILFPLLGLTYIIFIVSPEGNVARVIFIYCNAVLQSTQGLEVAVFYCFLNGEVRSTLKAKFNRWQDHRSLSTRYSRASITVHEHLAMSERHHNGFVDTKAKLAANANGTGGYVPCDRLLPDEHL